MYEVFFILIGFILAIGWDKYQEWAKFNTNIRWLAEELEEIRKSLEVEFDKLPPALKEKVKIAQEGGVSNPTKSDLKDLPIFQLMMPHKKSAWQNLLANGFASKLKEADYKVIRDAYDTLEGSDFIKGLTPSLLMGASSPILGPEAQADLANSTRLAPCIQ